MKDLKTIKSFTLLLNRSQTSTVLSLSLIYSLAMQIGKCNYKVKWNGNSVRLSVCYTCGSPQISKRMMVSLSDQGTFFLSSWIPTADSKETQIQERNNLNGWFHTSFDSWVHRFLLTFHSFVLNWPDCFCYIFVLSMPWYWRGFVTKLKHILLFNNTLIVLLLLWK